MRTEFAKLIKQVKKDNPEADLDLIRKAYRVADTAHRTQSRLSGEPYITHCLEVAGILAGLHMDATTLSAALLHDVLEDTDITLSDLQKDFGDQIAALVDGVTKIGTMHMGDVPPTHEEKQAGNLRKMLVATAKDVRVILIKLADRLHNLRTVEFLPQHKQERMCRESLDIYVPLANRLGLSRWKWELEDHAFHHLYPVEYKETARMVAMKRREREAMLEAPLEQWRIFLHPSQRKLVRMNANGPVRVLGGAGTGKTVVAMHRAKWLAENLDAAGGGRILFTTFTRNLAGDIERNLSSICRPEQMRKIDVINLDAWVKRFLEKHGYKVNFAFNEAVKAEIWGRALVLKPDTPALPDTFYKEEWEKVIQPQNVSTMEEYFRARRTGRGVRLNRAYRKVIWLVFENYRLGLNDAGLKEPEDAYRDAVTLISSKQIQVPYSSVIVDEAQDFGANAYRLLRAMVKEGANDMFIVGDAHQRIYGRKVVLGQCGIKIVGRSRKLRVNYRTTEQIRRWAVALLHGIPVDDLDDGIDEQKGYRSLMKGPEPEVRGFSGMEEEIEFLATSLGQISDEASSSTCVVARRQSDVDRYLSGLGSKGIVLHKISRSVSDDSTQPGIRIATMHRIKGLEFESVYIVGANKGIMPLDVLDTEDVTVVREHEWREKSLLYVAATRAKLYCSISSSGEPSPFLSGSVTS